MGSSESSKCGVSDIGVEETKKRMILDDHLKCIKAYLKDNIKFSNFGGVIVYPSEIRDVIDKIKKMLKEEKKIKENEGKEILVIKIKNIIDELTVEEIYDVLSFDNKKAFLSKFKLIEIDWKYNKEINNYHRELRLEFKCRECETTKYVIMDKTTSGKNISYGYKVYNCPPWWHWEKKPDKYYDFNDIMKYFSNASNEYHGISNNCMHFAYSIWSNIE